MREHGMSGSGQQPGLLDTFRMETNLPGLLTLLAEHLYSNKDVFIRELIQNAHDAIVERRKIDRDIGGRIDIEYNALKRTLTVRDNGIGMDEQDVKTFLSVIGSSNKTGPARAAEDLRRAADRDLIGQFGIGLLSAFVVAQEVSVTTLKVGSRQAIRWQNAASADCVLYEADKTSIGTDVTLHIREGYDFVLDHDYLRTAIVKYCQILQFPIFVNQSGPLNSDTPPWYRNSFGSQPERDREYRSFLNDRFPDLLLDVIPVHLDDGEFIAFGGLLISDRRSLSSETGGIDIFVPRMFIKAADASLLPPWAGFIRGVIDSPDLETNASRDNIKASGAAFKAVQIHLTKVIIDRLAEVARTDKDKFRRIISWHHIQIKAVACSYDEFFENVAHLLIFETNRGAMS
jgi:molecular chaperone HtpG